MKIPAGRAVGFCRKPQAGVVAVLVYGPDRGLVQERAESLARTVVDDLRDPFRVSELTGKTVAGDPALLADEAAAQALTGGRRVVRVRDAGNDAANAAAAWLEVAAGDSLVVVEAGELGPSSRLRKLFEAADNAAAVACYADDAASLEGVIDESLAGYGLRATPGARSALLARLGSDRKLSRAEIDKLALYVGEGAAEVDEGAVEAVVGDSASVTLDDLADAVAGGDHAGVGRSLARLHLDGVHPVGALRGISSDCIGLPPALTPKARSPGCARPSSSSASPPSRRSCGAGRRRPWRPRWSCCCKPRSTARAPACRPRRSAVRR